MKTKLLLTLCFLAVQLASAQEFYVKTGKNFTRYDYSNAAGASNSDLRGASGSAYEVGYTHSISAKFSYSAAITWDQFNASGANGGSTYSWNTDYIGIQNAVLFTILKTKKNLELNVKAGINTLTIANGRQLLNNQFYDLTNQDEFKGILFQPLVGFEVKYAVAPNFNVSFGYTTSRVFTNAKPESLSFINNQLQLGLHFPL
jgi:hypothetical protein